MTRTRSNRMVKSEKHRFNRLAWEWLASHGATEDTPSAFGVGDEAHRTFILPTTLGNLAVTPLGDWLACRWADVPRALAKIGRDSMNPYSGKWNHHCFDRCTAEAALSQMLLDITSYLPASSWFCLPEPGSRNWVLYSRDENLKLQRRCVKRSPKANAKIVEPIAA